MRGTFTTYRRVGHRLVTGFMQPGTLRLLEILDAAQRQRGVSGAMVEIGVHHGRLFIPMHLLQQGQGTSVAVDLFGDLERRIEASGSGDLRKFTDNVALWASMDGVRIHQGDSTELTPAALRELAGGPVRMFSVDGGHSAEVVHSDLRLAQATLADGGVVIADDVFNEQWPGVVEGTLRYLTGGHLFGDAAGDGGLAPFGIGFNKTLLAAPAWCDHYREALLAGVRDSARLQSLTTEFAGRVVEYVAPMTAVAHLRRSEHVRAAYHGGYRALVGGLRRATGRATGEGPGRPG